MNYQVAKVASENLAASTQSKLGGLAVALFMEGGQGVLPQIFRVIVLPRAAFERETRGGSPSQRLLAYAKRKGVEHRLPRNGQYGALPVARLSGRVFVWP